LNCIHLCIPLRDAAAARVARVDENQPFRVEFKSQVLVRTVEGVDKVAAEASEFRRRLERGLPGAGQNTTSASSGSDRGEGISAGAGSGAGTSAARSKKQQQAPSVRSARGGAAVVAAPTMVTTFPDVHARERLRAMGEPRTDWSVYTAFAKDPRSQQLALKAGAGYDEPATTPAALGTAARVEKGFDFFKLAPGSDDLFTRSHKAQYFQSEVVNQLVFGNRPGGTFLEFGGGDGVMHANTYFFEKVHKWKGICIEPVLAHYLDILDERECTAIHGAVCAAGGTRTFVEVLGTQGWGGFADSYSESSWDKIRTGVKAEELALRLTKVTCFTLSEIVAMMGIAVLDYLIIDVEGKEYEVLQTLDFGSRHFPKVLVVQIEVNERHYEIREYMTARGYLPPIRIDANHPDDIYIHKDLAGPELDERIRKSEVGCTEACRRVQMCKRESWRRDSAICSESVWVDGPPES
jgi:FkbM family methyltransferase